MGQLTSLLGREPLASAENNNGQANSQISNFRRRPASTMTNSNHRPLRRRRLRFWSTRNSEDNLTNERSSSPASNHDTFYFQSSSGLENPIQEALESLSTPSNGLTENSSRSGTTDEIFELHSDLFSMNTRNDYLRSSHASSSSSLRSSSIQDNDYLFPSLSAINTETPPTPPTPFGRRNGLNFTRQLETLSRLVEIAATSTILSLSNITSSNGRRVDNINRTSTLNEDVSSSRFQGLGNDSTFEEFIQGLRNGLLDRELPRSINEGQSTSGEGLCFFRAFRFDNPSTSNVGNNLNQDQRFNTSISFLPPGTTSVESSTNLNNSNQQSDPTNTEENNEQQMVPMLIIGIRSVLYNSPDNNAEEDFSTTRVNYLHETENNGSFRENPFTFESSGHGSEPETTPQTQEDSTNGGTTIEQRSWVIFVLGNSFPADSPILSAPSLVSENPTYEDMLHLQELLGEVKQPVTTKEELYKHDDQLFEVKLGTSNNDFEVKTMHNLFSDINPRDRCQICLTEYEDNEIVRKLSSCNHFYHKDCIDTWLLNGKNNCPLCRSEGIVNSEERKDQTLI